MQCVWWEGDRGREMEGGRWREGKCRVGRWREGGTPDIFLFVCVHYV